MTAEQPRVVDRPEENRLVVEVDGEVAELTYQRLGSRFVIRHTGVPQAIAGRGIAGALVRAAVEKAAAEGLSVVPICPYAVTWLRSHPEAAATVKVDR
jgi:hypothetical protein